MYCDGDKLNEYGVGRCWVGTDNFYDIEEDEDGMSPLTGEEEWFTVSELEAYRVEY